MKTVLGVGIVLALLSGPAWGQDPLPRLSGRVLTKGTRAGIPSAVVMLKSVSDSTAPVKGVQTDANGGSRSPDSRPATALWGWPDRSRREPTSRLRHSA